MPCPFCSLNEADLVHRGTHVVAFRDRFPVSDGHTLVIPRRHVETYFDASDDEKAEIWHVVDAVKAELDGSLEPPADGYNVGFNAGAAAGQTVMHLHVHVIPRRRGDVADPRGGVRHVIPERANYVARAELWTKDAAAAPSYVASSALRGTRLIRGVGDPLLPHLVEGLARAERVDIAVAFVLTSGVDRLLPHLREVLARGPLARVRLLTGDYLDGTDPFALRRLLDTADSVEAAGRLELYVFETRAAGRSFHPKAYVLQSGSAGDVAYVGSSNISATALETGVEWNYRVFEASGLAEVSAAFEALLASPHVRRLTTQWVDGYERRRRPPQRAVPAAPEHDEPPDAETETLTPATPHEVQQQALTALAATRAEGNRAGLVVLATGLGKTWLSAFDSMEFRRVLFVAHREEILNQARDTFRRVRPSSHLGMYTGKDKAPDADVLFASIQTLGRKDHLRRFARDAFDYIIVDEFHHAAARTYRELIAWFTPQFLLGLTATPERTDGGDLLGLCAENLVFRCDIPRGIGARLLAPFRYFGVADDVDYENIPWRSQRFDEAALTAAVATDTRAKNALEQLEAHGGKRALGFCASIRHAEFMRDFFRRAGKRAAAVHSEPTSDPRALSLERLDAGELDIVFAVDIFNEGVDVPSIDTVLMLRPTESRIVWLQQLGRGLRHQDGKTLSVIDYIGNHKTFLVKAGALCDLLVAVGGDALSTRELLRRLKDGSLDLPPGCDVRYDLEAIEILERLSAPSSGEAALTDWYQTFRELHGHRPTATEALHERMNPKLARKTHGSWLRFVGAMGDLTASEQAALSECGAFLDELDRTPMSKSYKMLVLHALLDAGAFPGELDLATLTEEFARVAQRSAKTRTDVSVDLADIAAVRKLLIENPIAAWTGGKGTGGVAYFIFDDRSFRFAIDVGPDRAPALADLTRELVDWRLADYLSSRTLEHGQLGVFKVIRASGGNPILKFDRRAVPNLPAGWTTVAANGESYEANFVKIALNVARRVGAEANVLPDLLRGWFGQDAGKPGTQQLVVCERTESGIVLRPRRDVE